VSVRGWLAILITITACVAASFEVPAPEWFQSMALLTVGFYFGQKQGA
jgi:hypothetical protein